METQRILGLLNDLYNDDPWLDITIVGTLKNISSEKAATKPKSGCNSIWEIVNHLIIWRETVLQRINGATISTPAENYFYEVKETSDSAWQETLQKLQSTQEKWQNFLTQMKDDELSGIYPGNGHTNYEHIHGIIQHDAYHLGQIVLIAKYLV